MEVVRGSIADRPWGLTFGQFGLRRVTGTLAVSAIDGRDYKVAFDQGTIVGATSPQTADSAIRVALTTNLITSPQVTNLQKQVAARATEDDVDVVIDVCKLDAMRSLKLRRKLTAQRAARTFSIEAGAFVLDDQISISTSYDASVDVRAVIYQGARLNLSETRLVSELRDLGSQFVLGEQALESFDWFGFEDTDRPILDELKVGATIAEIEAKHREVDPRQVQSVIYALVAYRQATSIGDSGPARKAARPGVSVSFKSPVEVDRRVRTPTGEPVPTAVTSKGSAPTAVTPTGSAPLRAPSPEVATRAARASTAPITARTATPPVPLPAISRVPSVNKRVPVQDESTPIAPRTSTLKGPLEPNRRPDPAITGLGGMDEEPTGSRNLTGVDLGPPPMPELAPFAGPEEPTLRRADPAPRDKPASISPRDKPASISPRDKPASISPRDKPASVPPSSPVLRPKTPSPSPGTGASASGSHPSMPRATSPSGSHPSIARTISQQPGVTISRTISQSSGVPPEREYSEGSDRVKQSISQATESFRRGREALDQNQLDVALAELGRAASLNPHEFEYTALFAYAQFCVATPAERTKTADKVRKMLGHATQKSTEPEQARFYLGRMERLLDRKKEAIAQFQQLLKVKPEHAGAAAELQDIEDKATEKAGFGLFRKKT